MKDAIIKQKHEREITVKTSKGEEFKFGGISEKFTKKLYEWETQKGIGPELSTIALLGPNNKGAEEKPAVANKKTSLSGLVRCKSEGSLGDTVGGVNTNSCENNSQNSSQSLNDLDKKDDASASFLDDDLKPGNKRDESELGARKKVKLSRSDSVRTQTSIQMLDENLSLIGSLKAKGAKCRELETALEVIDDKMHNVVRSRHELSLIKKEEEEEDKDETLMVHLDRKLNDLEREQDQLVRKQNNMQKFLAEETQMQKQMASTLICRLGSFRKVNPLPAILPDQINAPIATVEQDYIFSDLALMKRIHNLSELLADATKELETSVQRIQRRRSSSDVTSQSSSSLAVPSISLDLLQIMQELRKDMVEFLQRQESETLEGKAIENEEIENEFDEKPATKLPMPTTKLRHIRRRRKSSLNSLILPLSLSESDVSCGELSGRYVESEEDDLHSKISSNNSLSRYGSESPLHPLLSGFQSNNSDGYSDDFSYANGTKLKTYRLKMVDSNSVDSTATKKANFRKKRRPSSDNISTPNSGRSRSPSIVSSDCIAEEDAISTKCNSKMEEKKEVEKKEKEVSMTSIDQVCQLIHELKEQDLKHHKKRIEEHQEKLREQSKSRHCSSDESSNLKPVIEKGKRNNLTEPVKNVIEKKSITTQTDNEDKMNSNYGDTAQTIDSPEEEREQTMCLAHALVPTQKMKIIPPETNVLTPVRIDGMGLFSDIAERGTNNIVIGEKVRLFYEAPGPNRQSLASPPTPELPEEMKKSSSSSIEVFVKPKRNFLQLEEDRKNKWKHDKAETKTTKQNASKMKAKKNKLTLTITSPAAPSLVSQIENKPEMLIRSAPVKETEIPSTRSCSTVSIDPSIEALIGDMRSKSSSTTPITPPPVLSLGSYVSYLKSDETPSTPYDEALKSAHHRQILNQKNRENFLFGRIESVLEVLPEKSQEIPAQKLKNEAVSSLSSQSLTSEEQTENVKNKDQETNTSKDQEKAESKDQETTTSSKDQETIHLSHAKAKNKGDNSGKHVFPLVMSKLKPGRLRAGSFSSLHFNYSRTTSCETITDQETNAVSSMSRITEDVLLEESSKSSVSTYMQSIENKKHANVISQSSLSCPSSPVLDLRRRVSSKSHQHQSLSNRTPSTPHADNSKFHHGSWKLLSLFKQH